MLGLCAVVAIVYSVNMQGWRAIEPVHRAIARRLVKILSVLGYLALVTQSLTWAGETHGFVRGLWLVVGCGLLALMAVAIFLPGVAGWVWDRVRGRCPEDHKATSIVTTETT